MEAWLQAAAVSVDVSDTDSARANHSLETLELILHPTAVFSSLDENVARFVQYRCMTDELFQVTVVQPDHRLA